MAKKVYIGVNNVARKVKKGYIGVGNVARKIKKAYIGIGGVARPFWSGGEIAYYGAISSLSAGRGGTAAANAGTRLLIAGGATWFTVGSTHYATVDVYDTSLTRSSAPDRSVSGYHTQTNCGGASTGSGYALFAGAYNAKNKTSYKNVDAYSESLVKTVAAELPQAKINLSGFTIGGRAVFAGACTASYSSTLTQTTGSGLSGSDRANSASVGNYRILTADEVTNALAYDSDLTTRTLTKSQRGCVGCTGKGYALFADEDIAYAYTPDLTQVNLDRLSVSRKWSSTASLGEYSVFVGCDDSGNAKIADVYYGVTRQLQFTMANARQHSASGVVGDFALFCGGWSNATAEAFALV